MFGKKKKKKSAKNQTREYVAGIPQKIPELKVPTPPAEEQLKAEDVFAEGRSVGFQEGLIFSIQLLQDNLQRHQAQLKANLKAEGKLTEPETHSETPEVEIPPPVPEPTPRSGLYEIRLCDGCGAKNEVHKKKKAFVCSNCGEAST